MPTKLLRGPAVFGEDMEIEHARGYNGQLYFLCCWIFYLKDFGVPVVLKIF